MLGEVSEKRRRGAQTAFGYRYGKGRRMWNMHGNEQ